MQHRNKRRGASKLPEFAKNLNASQRSCLTKLTLTGQRDMVDKRPKRKRVEVAEANSKMETA